MMVARHRSRVAADYLGCRLSIWTAHHIGRRHLRAVRDQRQFGVRHTGRGPCGDRAPRAWIVFGGRVYPASARTKSQVLRKGRNPSAAPPAIRPVQSPCLGFPEPLQREPATARPAFRCLRVMGAAGTPRSPPARSRSPARRDRAGHSPARTARCARRRLSECGQFARIRWRPGEYVDHAFAAAYVDAPPPRIDEYVIGIAASVETPFQFAGRRREDHHVGRAAEDDEQPMLVGVDGHRKVRTRAGRVQGRNLLAGAGVDNRDLPGVRHVHEDAGARLVELEALRMALERHVGGLPACWIDPREGALAVADHDAVAPRIDADVVGIVAERDAAGRREVRTWNRRTDPSPALAT